MKIITTEERWVTDPDFPTVKVLRSVRTVETVRPKDDFEKALEKMGPVEFK